MLFFPRMGYDEEPHFVAIQDQILNILEPSSILGVQEWVPIF